MSYRAYIRVLNQESRREILEPRVNEEQSFTDTISNSVWRGGLAFGLLSFDGYSISHAALLRTLPKSPGTGLTSVEYSRFVLLEGVTLNSIASIDKGVDNFITIGVENRGGPIPAKNWKKIFAFLQSRQKDDIVKRLYEIVEICLNPGRRRHNELSLDEQKLDAVGLAIDAAGFNRKERLSGVKRSSVLEGKLFDALRAERIDPDRVLEDVFINHDNKTMPNWKLEPEMHPRLEAVRFTKTNAELVIMNVNRKNTETVTGVDLIYLNELYRSFVMVQYKMLRQDGNEVMWRIQDPDNDKQLRAMREISMHLTTENKQMDQYRLHANPFYYKLCRATENELDTNQLAPGTYVPLDYLEILLKSNRTLGEKNGRRVTEDCLDHNFSNSLFVNLLQAGLIGSKGIDTLLILKIIEESLHDTKDTIFAIKRATDIRAQK